MWWFMGLTKFVSWELRAWWKFFYTVISLMPIPKILWLKLLLDQPLFGKGFCLLWERVAAMSNRGVEELVLSTSLLPLPSKNGQHLIFTSNTCTTNVFINRFSYFPSLVKMGWPIRCFDIWFYFAGVGL
jgi:hypothetical protein